MSMSGGFGLCETPENLIASLRDRGAKDLTVISNNGVIDGIGMGQHLESRIITTLIAAMEKYSAKTGVFSHSIDGGEATTICFQRA